MCNVGLIGLGISALGVGAQAISASQQQAAYADYQALQSKAALDNYIQQTKQVNLRYSQEQEANAEERQQIQIQNMKAKATAQASAASSGIEGITIDNLFAGYERATAVSNYTHARNLEMLGLEYNNQIDTYRMQALSSIYSMQPYQGATMGSTLLSGVGGIMSNYADMTWKQNFYGKGSSSMSKGISWLRGNHSTASGIKMSLSHDIGGIV
mgnify:CR=1 FL=1